MVAAYLRGLLKPRTMYGLRSDLAEDVLLEAILADVQAKGYETSILTDASIIPALTDESKETTLRSIRAKLGRVTELKMFDIYCLAKASRHLKGKKNEVSLYQLYHLADKYGILTALRDHISAENSRDQS